MTQAPESDERYAVQVRSRSGKFRGSGFFVGPRTVVTCAHVVKDLPDQVVVRWLGQDLPASVLVREPAQHDGGPGEYPLPDIAFLGVKEVDNPIPVIDSRPPPTGGPPALLTGFSLHNPENRVRRQLREVRITGRSEGLITLDGRDVLPGMSGCPLIAEGRVRGMLKTGMLSRGMSAYALNGKGLNDALRRHAGVLGGHRSTRPPLRRLGPDDPLRPLLTAQVQAAKRFPYQIAELTRRRPPSLSDVYVEQRAEARRPRTTSAAEGSFEPVVLRPPHMLRLHRHAVVVGGAGSGKSTLLHSLAGAAAAWWLDAGPPAGDDPGPPAGRTVPIVVSAVDLVEDRPWYDSVAGSVARGLGGLLDDRPAAAMFRHPPAYGADWLVLVDGLDEVPQRDMRERLIRTLAHRIRDYNVPVRFLVASRALHDSEFDLLRVGFEPGERGRRLGEYTLRPFDREAVEAFAGKWFRGAEGEPAGFLRAVEVGRLSQLMQVPLLATITAIVYEERPHRPLPLDRAGLYASFVQVLLTMRSSHLDVREGLRRRLRPYGAAAEEYGEFLFDNREACLRFTAAQHLTRRIPVRAALAEWVRRQPRPMPTGVTLDHVADLICGTGLVHRRGGDLVFLHQSFAEYLAAMVLADTFKPAEWLNADRIEELDSLGLFRFAEWIRRGNDPMPLITSKLTLRRQRRHAHLRDVAVLIEDGGVLTGPAEAGLMAVTWRALREVDSGGEAETTSINQTLRAIFQRTRDAGPFAELMADRRAQVGKRVEAARVLIADGSPAEREAAVAQLVEFAYRSRLSDHDRMWALLTLAESGGARERPHAVQSLVAIAETAQDVQIRSRAIALLSQADEVVAASAALARRAMDGRLGVGERLSTLGLLSTYLLLEARSEMRPDATADRTELDEGGWRPVARPSFASRLAEVQIEYYVGQLSWVIALLARHDPVVAHRLVQRFVRDRQLSWIRRWALIQELGSRGLREIAGAAVLSIARDPAEAPANRVVLLELSQREGFSPAPLRRRMLIDWLRDPDQGGRLRQIALDAYLREQPAEVARRLAGDRDLTLQLRISAAQRLTADLAGLDEARALIRAMAAEDGRSARDRLVVRLALAGLWLGGGLARLSEPYNPR